MFEFSASYAIMLPAMLLKIAVAILCGILLGVEREIKDKPAGLRTMVLITVGSALYMIVSELIPLIAEGSDTILRTDPGRIAAQVVTGIGFLGAGAIIRARGAVHGLTTAAVIWVAAGIGLCVGAGFPLLGLGTTLIVLLTLTALNPLRRWLSRRAVVREITFRLPNDAVVLQRAEFLLEEYDVDRTEYTVTSADPGELEMRASLRAESDAASRFLSALAQIPGVHGPAVR